MKEVLVQIKKWWDGEWYTPPNDPNSPIFFVGHMEYPVPRRAWDTLCRNFHRNWQFWIGSVIGVIGIVVSLKM